MTQPQPSEVYTEQHPSAPRRPIPWWVHALVWVVVILIDAALGTMVLLMAAFACDSGAAGCADVASSAIVGYGLAAMFLSTAPLVAAVLLRGESRAVRIWRIITLILIIASPLFALGITVLIFAIGFSLIT
ncbi:MAG: hypothetical protein RLZ55_252 [Actinomycetota bacterium]|jgi:hypothetical protein